MSNLLWIFLIFHYHATTFSLGMSKKHRVFLSTNTAREARDLLQQHSTDAVLFDIDVHDVAAADFIESLKQEQPRRPVFLLASRPWAPDELKGLVDGVFEKMDDPRQMLSFLGEYFKEST